MSILCEKISYSFALLDLQLWLVWAGECVCVRKCMSVWVFEWLGVCVSGGLSVNEGAYFCFYCQLYVGEQLTAAAAEEKTTTSIRERIQKGAENGRGREVSRGGQNMHIHLKKWFETYQKLLLEFIIILWQLNASNHDESG